MKGLLAVGLAIACIASSSSTALGHGGQYRGPGDVVPPNTGGHGGTPTPPGNPDGTGTGKPGAPVTRAPGGHTGGGGVNPLGGPPTRPNRGTSFRKANRAEGHERWEFWWEFNKEPYLNLRSRLANNVTITNSTGFLVGRSKSTGITSNRPTAHDTKDLILPAIIPLLEESHADVVDSAAMALGRVVRAENAELVLQSLVDTLDHSAQTAREAATLALGVLGSADAVPVLRTLLHDTREGRQYNGRAVGVEDRVRAFAAASLGMIGNSECIQDLKDVISDPRLNSNRDLKALAIQALGMMPGGHEEIVPFLMGLMNDRSLDRIVRAQAPIALGKLKDLHQGSDAATAALAEVVEQFENPKTDNDLLRSLAVCLGMLAEIKDTEAISALTHAVRKVNDAQTRHFALISLAQIGHRDTKPAAHEEAHASLSRFLQTELAKPTRITHKPFAALALAIYGRNEALVERGTDVEFGFKILESFERDNNPSYKGAMAVALGLLDFNPAQDSLWNEFQDSRNQPMKGYIAISLGLMRAPHGETFRTLVRKKGLEFKFRLQLARALGLAGDVQAMPTLIASLQESGTLNEASSAAKALGLIGDKDALPPLLKLVKDGSEQPSTRGFATIAVGIIAEKTDLPWNWIFGVNSNYQARVPAMSEILDIL